MLIVLKHKAATVFFFSHISLDSLCFAFSSHHRSCVVMDTLIAFSCALISHH